MKNPRRGDGGAEQLFPADSRPIVTPCPYSEDCKRWTSDDETETAACDLCGQVLDRPELYRMLAGVL